MLIVFVLMVPGLWIQVLAFLEVLPGSTQILGLSPSRIVRPLCVRTRIVWLLIRV